MTALIHLSDFGNTVSIDTGLLRWQPFKKGIILASVFITTVDPHTPRIVHDLLLLSFRCELPSYPPCSSDRCSNAWENTACTEVRKWKWLFANAGNTGAQFLLVQNFRTRSLVEEVSWRLSLTILQCKKCATFSVVVGMTYGR